MSDTETCEDRLGLAFNNRCLLEQAFIHSSYVNESESSGVSSNERLEFLGDAVLGLVIADELYRTRPSDHEGKLTHVRAAVVRKHTLATVARDLGLGDFLRLGKGEEATGGRSKASNLANVFEAVIGAAYLDQGLEAARSVVLRHLSRHLKQALDSEFPANYKALLQEYLQAHNEPLPKYRTIAVEGPDHKKHFTVEVLLRGEPAGRGEGYTKKSAETAAARSAWKRLKQKEV